MHMINFDPVGARQKTLCGRDLRDVRWTAGYRDRGPDRPLMRERITCAACLRTERVMQRKGETNGVAGHRDGMRDRA